jgi:hypothetical protein
VLTIEEPFGTLVEALRMQVGIAYRKDMPKAMQQTVGDAVSLRALDLIEKGHTAQPNPETVLLLARFFFQRGAL